MKSSCERCERDALDWCFGELGSDAARSFEDHLDAHPEHRAELAELTHTFTQARRRDGLEPSAAILASLKLDARCAIAEQRAEQRVARRAADRDDPHPSRPRARPGWFRQPFTLPLWSGAAAAALLLFAGMWLARETPAPQSAHNITGPRVGRVETRETTKLSDAQPLELPYASPPPPAPERAAARATAASPLAAEAPAQPRPAIRNDVNEADDRGALAAAGASLAASESATAAESDGAIDTTATTSVDTKAVVARLQANDLEGALSALAGKDIASAAKRPQAPHALAQSSRAGEIMAESEETAMERIVAAAVASDDPRLQDAALALLLRLGRAPDDARSQGANLAAVELALALDRLAEANAAAALLPPSSPERARAEQAIRAGTARP